MSKMNTDECKLWDILASKIDVANLNDAQIRDILKNIGAILKSRREFVAVLTQEEK